MRPAAFVCLLLTGMLWQARFIHGGLTDQDRLFIGSIALFILILMLLPTVAALRHDFRGTLLRGWRETCDMVAVTFGGHAAQERVFARWNDEHSQRVHERLQLALERIRAEKRVKRAKIVQHRVGDPPF